MSIPNVPYDVPEELNDPNGDIVLRSSDQVDFRVFRWPLQRLYPVFSDMFHLPNPPTSSEPSTPPVVQMDETAPVIEALLRLSYPIAPPTIKDPHIIALVIEAIVKLQAEQQCRWWIRSTTETMATVNPWAMYAILLASGRKACGYNFEDEIRIAARSTVGQQVIRPWKEASMITAADYDRLLVYHSDCRSTFLGSEEAVWGNAGVYWSWFRSHGVFQSHCPAREIIAVGNQNYEVSPWFSEFRTKAKEAFSRDLRGQAIEDTGLWCPSLFRDLQAKLVCHACARSATLQMPVYGKLLSAFMEETISRVTSSFNLSIIHVGC